MILYVGAILVTVFTSIVTQRNIRDMISRLSRLLCRHRIDKYRKMRVENNPWPASTYLALYITRSRSIARLGLVIVVMRRCSTACRSRKVTAAAPTTATFRYSEDDSQRIPANTIRSTHVPCFITNEAQTLAFGTYRNVNSQ